MSEPDICAYPACDCGYPPCQNGWPLKEGLERALVIAQEWGDSPVVKDIEDELAAFPKDRPKDRPNMAMLSDAALEAAESAYWKDPPPQGAYERMRAAIAAAFATAYRL